MGDDFKTCICERRHEAASLTLLFYNMRKKVYYSILLQEMIRILCLKLCGCLKKIDRNCINIAYCLSRIHVVYLSI